MRLTLLAIAWLAGILLGAGLKLPPPILFIALAPLPLLFVPRLRRAALMLSLCLLALSGGALYYVASNDPSALSQHNGQE